MKDTDAGATTVDQVEDESPLQSTAIISTRENNPKIGQSLLNAKQERQKEPPRDRHQQRWNGGKANLPAHSRQGKEAGRGNKSLTKRWIDAIDGGTLSKLT
jgi:hypothetical protein